MIMALMLGKSPKPGQRFTSMDFFWPLASGTASGALISERIGASRRSYQSLPSFLRPAAGAVPLRLRAIWV